MLTVFYKGFTYYNVVCIKFSKNDDDTIMIILEKQNGKSTYFNIDHIIDLTILPQKYFTSKTNKQITDHN